MVSDSVFVPLDRVNIEKFVSHPSPYPEAYPGNIRPTKRPDYSTLVLYEVMRGMNVNYSFRRMVKMLSNIDEVETIVRQFVKNEDSNPDRAGYLNLADAVAQHYGIDFTYEPTEEGHMIRVWGKDNEEWAMQLRRGENRLRRQPKRDYSKLLGVRKIDMLSYNRVRFADVELIKPFRLHKRKG